MKSKFFIPVLILLVLSVGGIYLISQKGRGVGLLSPQKGTSAKITPSPQPTPTPTPPVFHFNRSTDLEAELDKVDPQVEASDFTELKNLISAF